MSIDVAEGRRLLAEVISSITASYESWLTSNNALRSWLVHNAAALLDAASELATARQQLAECHNSAQQALDHAAEGWRRAELAMGRANQLERERDELRKRLANWGQSITVRSFLRDYANECFQMQGAYAGAMSEECKKRFKEDYIFTRELIVLIQGNPCPLCKGKFDEIRGVFGCKVCNGSGLAQPGTPGEG